VKYRDWKWGTEPFFPNHLLRMGLMITGALIVFSALVFYLPGPFLPPEEPANPDVTPEHVKPEWYFLASYQMLKLISTNYIDVQRVLRFVSNEFAGVALQGIAVLIILLLPFLDRSKERNPLKRPVFFALALAAVIAYVVLTIWGIYS